MGPETFFDRIRDLIGSSAWRIFLWSNRMTEEQYWEQIYVQEKNYHELTPSSPEERKGE